MKVLIFVLVFFTILDLSVQNEHSYPKTSGGPTSSESKSNGGDTQCEKDESKKQGTKAISEIYKPSKKNLLVLRDFAGMGALGSDMAESHGAEMEPSVPRVTAAPGAKSMPSGYKTRLLHSSVDKANDKDGLASLPTDKVSSESELGGLSMPDVHNPSTIPSGTALPGAGNSLVPGDAGLSTNPVPSSGPPLGNGSLPVIGNTVLPDAGNSLVPSDDGLSTNAVPSSGRSLGTASLPNELPVDGSVPGPFTAENISNVLKVDAYSEGLADILRRLLPEFDPVEEFKAFLTKYAKAYPSQDELTTAFSNFVSNYYDMVQLALSRRSAFDASFGVTEFMDLCFAVFVKGATGAMVSKEDVSEHFTMPKLEKRETKGKCNAVNWTSTGVVPEVRKQKKCGCCYAMSSTDTIAAQHQIDKQQFKKKLHLSPQWMVDCFENPVADHCNGGRPNKVMGKVADFTKDNKFPLESCYKYNDTNSTCKKEACSGAPDLKVYWGKMLDASGKDEMNIMAGILQHGPLVTIVAVNKAWMVYNGTGIMRASQCSETQNHAVMVVGYDYKGCVPYYIIKNSWGEPWGGKGHILLEAGKNACKVASNVVFICTSDSCKDEDDKVKYVMSHPKYPDCKH